MNNQTISQEYLLCAVNEKGMLPVMSPETAVCLVAGSLLDLLLADCAVLDEKECVTVTGALPADLLYLSPLYEVLSRLNSIKLEKIAAEYAFTFTDKQLKLLIGTIGASLAEAGSVREEIGGLFGKTQCFIPQAEAVDAVIQKVRAELLEEGPLCDETVALVSLLQTGGQLKRYFSSYEKAQLKARLKEIKQTPSNQLVHRMVEYIDTMIAVMAAV